MNYSKKISWPIILFALFFAMITGMSYVLNEIVPILVLVFTCVLSPFIGYLFTYMGIKKNNKLFLIYSIFFYNIFVSSIIAGAYTAKKIPIDLIDISYLSLIAFVLISIVYIFIAKCKSMVVPTFIWIILMLVSSSLVWILINNSYIKDTSLIYGISMLILVAFFYISSLIAKNNDINIIKVISNSFENIFHIIIFFIDKSGYELPKAEDDQYYNGENEKDAVIKENYNQEDVKESKEEMIYKNKHYTNFSSHLKIIIANAIFIIALAIIILKVSNYNSTARIPMIIVFIFMIVCCLKNLYNLYKIIIICKKGVEAYAFNFNTAQKRAFFGYIYYIFYSYETKNGKIKRKNQLVSKSIYECIGHIENLPIRVLDFDASIDIKKLNNL